MSSLSYRATDSQQYDRGEVIWEQEGGGLNHMRRLFLERLSPHLGSMAGSRALDIGCGQGWLVDELAKKGADALGIDPSHKNIDAAKALHPALDFQQTTFEDLLLGDFDLITMVMVLEHCRDLTQTFDKVRSLLKMGGQLITITGDFQKFTHSRFGYRVDTETIGPGEVATRTDYGDRAGVIYDINRTAELCIERALISGLSLRAHEPITPPEWMVEEKPEYAQFADEPLFHLVHYVR